MIFFLIVFFNDLHLFICVYRVRFYYSHCHSRYSLGFFCLPFDMWQDKWDHIQFLKDDIFSVLKYYFLKMYFWDLHTMSQNRTCMAIYTLLQSLARNQLDSVILCSVCIIYFISTLEWQLSLFVYNLFLENAYLHVYNIRVHNVK